jgi:hypothetical protein
MFEVIEYMDDGVVANNEFTARELCIWLHYLHPSSRLRDYKERGFTYNFTICDAIVSITRL